jgi:tripeptidyl-peptidase-1
MQRQCLEYLKLSMQGVSVVVSSGDYGVAQPPGGDSVNGCLGAGLLGNGTIFNTQFPASCPYVTTLGATFIPKGGDVRKDQETATTRFSSGGGFSNIFGIPEYQKADVEKYLHKHTPPYKSYGHQNITGGIYNHTGRGYPDFSAIGDNIVIFLEGKPALKGGTSASAPVFAAILTRINEERIAVGKSTVGFVNPTLVS